MAAVVAGNMLGSGIFFTPGELAAVAQQNWQIYFFWTLSGLITLCGALTLAELSSTIPESGSSYHIIREAFGEFWGFLKIWVEMLVSGPGSVAGLAIAFGTYFSENLQLASSWAPSICGSVAILFFAAINILGIQWGGRTQITLTTVKILALLALVLSSFFFISPQTTPVQNSSAFSSGDMIAILRFIGLGVAIVLYTYDGWVDVTHAAGEISEPQKNLPRGLILGVCIIIVLYVLVNHAFLRAVPLAEMKENPALVGAAVAEKSFGPEGGKIIQWVIMISIFGSLGGLMMTLPRLYYGAASHLAPRISNGTVPHRFFHALSKISTQTSVPVASIVFCATVSVLALLFFRSFAKIVNFFVVPLQFINILMVASIYTFRRRMNAPSDRYRTPGYPVVPFLFIFVMSLFLISAIYYNPKDTLIGIALASTAIPVFWWIKKYEVRS